MRFGRIITANPANVEAPAIGFTLFQSSVDGLWYTIDVNGTIEPFQGSSSVLAPDGIAAGTADAIELTVNNYNSYTNGDLIIMVVTAENTGATTIDINGLGVKDIHKKGNFGIDTEAGDFQVNDQVAMIYLSGTDDFQVIGKVEGDHVVLKETISYDEIAAVAGASTSASVVVFQLPGGGYIEHGYVVGNAPFAGGSVTNVEINLEEKAAGIDVFGGNVQVFAPNDGGTTNGLKSETDLPSLKNPNPYEADFEATGDDWDQLTGGELIIAVKWNIFN